MPSIGFHENFILHYCKTVFTHDMLILVLVHKSSVSLFKILMKVFKAECMYEVIVHRYMLTQNTPESEFCKKICAAPLKCCTVHHIPTYPVEWSTKTKMPLFYAEQTQI